MQLDVQTPSAAISEIAKGVSDLRDALKAMTELATGDCAVSALVPYLRQARDPGGATAECGTSALTGTMPRHAQDVRVALADLEHEQDVEPAAA